MDLVRRWPGPSNRIYPSGFLEGFMLKLSLVLGFLKPELSILLLANFTFAVVKSLLSLSSAGMS